MERLRNERRSISPNKKGFTRDIKRVSCRSLLYGSWARGEEKQSSDIDVAINPHEDLPVGLLSEIRESFENSTIPYRIEIVNLATTDKTFSEKVLDEGIEWNL